MESGYKLYSNMQNQAGKLQEAMKAEKQRQGKTNQQLIDESGVARSTVNNYFAGQLGNLGIIQAAALCHVLGVSLDDNLGLHHQAGDDGQEVERLRAELRHKEEMIAALRAGIKERNAAISGILRLCILLGAALMVYMVLDARRPDVGLIRGNGVSPIIIGVCVLGVCGGVWTACRVVKERRRRRQRE